MDFRHFGLIAGGLLTACAGGAPAETAEPAAEASGAAETTVTVETEAVAAVPAVASTQQVLEHHLKSFGERNMQEILQDYTDESVIITPLGTFKGAAGFEALATGLFAEFAKPGASFSMVNQGVDGDVAYVYWTAETADNVYEMGSDTFVVRDRESASPKQAERNQHGEGSPRNV